VLCPYPRPGLSQNITFGAAFGIAYSGKAKNAAEKELATKFANDVKGVKSVNNQMTIE